MTKLTPVNKFSVYLLILLLPAFLFTLQSCKKKRSEMANVLFKKTHNKVFQDFEPDSFAVVFKKVLSDKKARVSINS